MAKLDMDWQKVADDLRATADDAVNKVEALRKHVVYRNQIDALNDVAMIERIKTVERHRINANFCYALAQALEAGLGGD